MIERLPFGVYLITIITTVAVTASAHNPLNIQCPFLLVHRRSLVCSVFSSFSIDSRCQICCSFWICNSLCSEFLRFLKSIFVPVTVRVGLYAVRCTLPIYYSFPFPFNNDVLRKNMRLSSKKLLEFFLHIKLEAIMRK